MVWTKIALLAPLLLLLGAGWPTNVVTVTDSIDHNDCTVGDEYACCTGAGTGCDGYGGEDIADALLICESADGCVLQLPCADVERAEVSIANLAATNRFGGSFTTGFTNGLVIQGCGKFGPTTLKSSIPPRVDDGGRGPSRAIFYFRNWDASATAGFQQALPKIAFTDFECYGQADVQPAFRVVDWGEGVDAAVNHNCFDQEGGFHGNNDIHEIVKFQRLYIHDFVTHGIFPKEAGQVIITGNDFAYTGCWQDYSNTLCDDGPGPNDYCAGVDLDVYGAFLDCCTGEGTGTCTPLPCCTASGAGTCSTTGGWVGENAPVSGEIECGRNSGQPDNYGWDIQRENLNTQKGQKATGGAIWTSGHARLLVARNNMTHILKYAANSQYIPSFSIFTKASHSLGRLAYNVIDDGDRLMAGTHFAKVWIDHNQISNWGKEGDPTNNDNAIGCSYWGKSLRINDNTLSSGDANAFGIDCYPYHGGGANTAPNWLRIENNTISDSGYWPSLDKYIQAAGLNIYSFQTGATCAHGSVGGPPIAGDAVISGNTWTNQSASTIGYSIHSFSADHTCPSGTFRKLTFSNNVMPRPDDGSTGANIGSAHAANIDSVSNTIGSGGTWTWLLGSAGSCSGWTTGGATVVDNSGNSIGDCAP